jgi:hypothetical protein
VTDTERLDDRDRDRLEDDLRAARDAARRMARLEERLDEKYWTRDFLDMKLALISTEIRTLTERLVNIESERTWLVRIVIGTVVSAILGLLVVAKDRGI